MFIALIAADEFDDMMDGFVYGAMVGLGFAVVEDVLYFIAIFGGTPSGVLAGFYVRVISSGLYGHVLYTGLSGMGIAYFVSRRGEETRSKRIGVAVLLFLVAAFGHFLWDSPLLNFFPGRLDTVGDWLQIPLAAAIKGIPARVRDRARQARPSARARWLELALASEVGSAALTLAGARHPVGSACPASVAT